MQYDVLIRGGLLFDGTGSPGVPGDVAVLRGRIAAIGPDLPGDAAETIDATGLAVCPGFKAAVRRVILGGFAGHHRPARRVAGGA